MDNKVNIGKCDHVDLEVLIKMRTEVLTEYIKKVKALKKDAAEIE